MNKPEEVFEVVIRWDGDRARPFLPGLRMENGQRGVKIQLMTRSELLRLESLQDRFPNVQIHVHATPLLAITHAEDGKR